MDHLRKTNQLIKKTTEYNKTSCVAFVERGKIDSTDREAILKSLREHKLNEHITTLLQRLYANITLVISLCDQ